MDVTTSLKKKNEKLHERALRLVYDDRQSIFEELVKKLQSLSTTEMCRVLLQNCIKFITD